MTKNIGTLQSDGNVEWGDELTITRLAPQEHHTQSLVGWDKINNNMCQVELGFPSFYEKDKVRSSSLPLTRLVRKTSRTRRGEEGSVKPTFSSSCLKHLGTKRDIWKSWGAERKVLDKAWTRTPDFLLVRVRVVSQTSFWNEKYGNKLRGWQSSRSTFPIRYSTSHGWEGRRVSLLLWKSEQSTNQFGWKELYHHRMCRRICVLISSGH